MASRAEFASPVRAIVLAVCGFELASTAAAQDLRLDPSFGIGGIVLDTSSDLFILRSLVQPDGKVLVAGMSDAQTLIRYLSNGSPDPTFAVPTLPLDFLTGLALQADGKILLAGYVFPQVFTVVRLLENGTPDPSFDGDGVVTTLFSGDEYSRSVSVQPDGRIVVVGYDQMANRIVLARYLEAGGLDPSFGTNGKVVGPVSGNPSRVLLDSQGRIVVDGLHHLVRFLPGGAPDPSFGVQGVVSLSEDVFPQSIAVTPTDAVLLIWNSFTEIFVERYTAAGVLDPTFGDGGVVHRGTASFQNAAYAAAVHSDGRIYLAGTWTGALFLERLLENGQLDPTFGIDGSLRTTVRDFAGARDLAIRSDGSVILAGSSSDFVTMTSAPALTRYVACAGPSQPPPTITSVQPDTVASNEVLFQVTGTGFDPAAEIRAGLAAGFVVGSPAPGTIDVATFDHPFGHIDVTVRNPDCQSVTLADAVYLYPLDYPPGNPYYAFVKRLVVNGVTAGCSPLFFCGSDSVTRAQMAVFLLRSKEGSSYVPPPATGTVFADVPIDGFAAAWIEELAARGITAGCDVDLYCPDTLNTRAQMAVFLLVTLEGMGYQPPAATGIFDDVPSSSPYASWIEEIFERGITAGCGANNYCPEQAVLREQMAVFLSVTFNLPG